MTKTTYSIVISTVLSTVLRVVLYLVVIIYFARRFGEGVCVFAAAAYSYSQLSYTSQCLLATATTYTIATHTYTGTVV